MQLPLILLGSFEEVQAGFDSVQMMLQTLQSRDKSSYLIFSELLAHRIHEHNNMLYISYKMIYFTIFGFSVMQH